MVKDPLDNGRTADLFGENSGENSGENTPTVEQVVEAIRSEFKTTLTPEQIAVADSELRNKSYGGRHPELGKMVKCQVHGFRHRQFEFNPVSGCVQKFTHTVKDKDGRLYEQFREEIVTDPDGEEGPNGEVPKKVTLVPDLRTAVSPDLKPTIKQVVGAAQFNKRRHRPHYSKIKLQLIQRTRTVFEAEGFFALDETEDRFRDLMPDVQEKVRQYFQEDLQRARIIAARQIRKERELSDREYRRRTDRSRRINKGLV